MRVNVYNEELGPKAQVVETKAQTGETFYGARVYLESTNKLHNTAEDDDRSAVTFWFGGHAAAERFVNFFNRSILTSAHVGSSD